MNIKYIIFAIGTFLLIAGTYLLYGWPMRYTQAPSGDSNSLRVGTNAIYVSDQKPGNSIEVGFVALHEPGFVVIHSGANERPGEILGESVLINAGETNTISPIILTRQTQDGETLFAMLHRDDGDRVFNAVQDGPVQDEQGEILMTRFMIDVLSEEPGAVSL